MNIYVYVMYKICSRFGLDTPGLERTEYFIDSLKRETDLSDVLKIDTQMKTFRNLQHIDVGPIMCTK